MLNVLSTISTRKNPVMLPFFPDKPFPEAASPSTEGRDCPQHSAEALPAYSHRSL